MKYLLLILPLAILFWSCDQEPEPIRPHSFNKSNTIDLGNPTVGQKTYYQLYESNCGSLNKDFNYVGDTLIVEITKQDDHWIMLEYLTEHSVNYSPLDTIYNPFYPDKQNTLIPNRFVSRLFFFYGNDTLRLQPDNRTKLIQKQCRLEINGDVFVGNEVGQLNSFELPDMEVKDKTAVSCVPLVLSLEGYLIYDESELYVSHTILSSDRITGWVRL
ncbi:MAG: hypothetical protein MRZ79_02365 [Bacteroidia bacterium]|nr:hypothetical protein [Bacteroidia bacterium]